MDDDGSLFCEAPTDLSPPHPKRQRLTRKGGIEFRARSTHLPMGPTTFEELMQWPQFVLKEVLSDPQRKDRLWAVLNRGLSVTSAYSGMDAPREALEQLAQSLRVDYLNWPQIRFVHSCDIASLPQYVLRWLSTHKDHGSSCVFADLEDRLPQDARATLESLQPEEDSAKEEKSAAYQAMWQYLMENRKACFHEYATCWCCVHNRECRVIGDPVPSDFDSQDSLGSPGPGGGMVPPQPGKKPVRIHFAGTVCKGWSQAGSGGKFSHESERPHAIWLAERMARCEQGREDVFFQECTPQYPAQTRLRSTLAETHQLLVVRTGPELQGWPITRPRVFTAGIAKRKWEWVGPPTDLGVQQEFDMMFGRSTELTGDVFFQAGDVLVRSDIFSRLKKRGGVADVGQSLELGHELLHAMLPPGASQRLTQYEKMRAEKMSIEDGSFLCDVNQWPETGCSTAGAFFPCQLTHATVVSLNKMRPAIGLEYLAAQGFRVFSQANAPHRATALEAFKELTTEKLVQLSGNSMALPAFAAWIVYVLANIQPKQKEMPIVPEKSMMQKGLSEEFQSPSK